MTKKILSHPLDSDSDCSDSEQDNSYADVIAKKLSKLESSSSCEDRVAKKIPGVSSVDFILAFVAHKVLSCPPVRSSYTKIKSPLEFITKEKPNDANINDINRLITQQHKINNDLQDSFLFMPVVSNTLQQKYDKFQTSDLKLTFNDNLNLDGSIEDIVHRVKMLLSINLPTDSDTNFIQALKPFIQYLTTSPTIPELNMEESFNEISHNVLKNLKKHFIKDRIYSFPEDIIKIIKNKKKYLHKKKYLEKQREELLKSAICKYKIHKEEIHKVVLAAVQYHDQYDYGQVVKNADFLPQVLYYARATKNLIKNKILSKDNYKKIDKLLPHVTEDVPVMVRIYNTLATNLFVHNVGSYADIAKENIFDTYMKYFLHRTPAEITVKKEAALYVLMQIEVIRNPSALLTNVMFLLLVQAKFKSLRCVEEKDSKYCWANIEKQLPVAIQNAVNESIYIEYNLFSHGLISGKRLFDYRQIINSLIWGNENIQLRYRNSDILFDWICYKINAKQILDQLNEGLHDQTILIVNGIQYKVKHENKKIILANSEYTLCFKLFNQSTTDIKTHSMTTRSMTSTKQNANKDGNSTTTNEEAYYLESINDFPLNVFDQIIKQYRVNGQEIKLDKLQGCVNISVTPRDIQQYPTPEKSVSSQNTSFSNMDCEENNSSQESPPNKSRRVDMSDAAFTSTPPGKQEVKRRHLDLDVEAGSSREPIQHELEESTSTTTCLVVGDVYDLD